MSTSLKTSYPKDKIKVLFLENISEAAVQYFKIQGYTDVKKVTGALSEEELIKVIKDVHILGIRSKTFISKKVLDSAKKLQAIGCFCIGTNQVDLKACKQKGIAVFNAPYSNTRSVAELVIGSSIMLIRKIIDKNGDGILDANPLVFMICDIVGNRIGIVFQFYIRGTLQTVFLSK